MPACLLLVRHAQSANNAQHESLRIPDPPITALGEVQSQRLALAMPAWNPTLVLVSPFLRSIQTAMPLVASTGAPARIRQDIFEQGGCYRGYRIDDRHPMPGMNRDELVSLCPDWEIDPRIGEQGWNDLSAYESLEAARARARRVVAAIASDATLREHRVALVIHADFKLRMLEACLERDDLEERLGDVINTSITRLTHAAGRWKLDVWNSHQHLEPELVTS